MKGRTSCGVANVTSKFLQSHATLKIITPPSSTISVSNGTISETLDSSWKVKDTDIYSVWIYFIDVVAFGTWTVNVTFDGITKQWNAVVDSTNEYEINIICPVGYQQITYIGASTNATEGAERINTGTVPTSTICVSCHYMTPSGLDYSSYAWRPLFGIDGDDGIDTFKFQQYDNTQMGQVSINASYTNGCETAFSAGYHYVKIDVKNGILINDEFTAPLSLVSLTFTHTINIVRPIWCTSSKIVSQRPPSARTQDFKIYDDDVLIQYFIPCYRMSDNVIGMYELVNGQFYTTAGTVGGFVSGGNLVY